MDKRLIISKKPFFKKYLLSWLLPLLVLLINNYIYNHFIVKLIFIYTIIQGVFYLMLKNITFDENYIYVNGERIPFDKVIDFKTFSQKTSVFLFFKLSNRSFFKTYIWCELKGIGFKTIFKSLFGMKSAINVFDDFRLLLISKSNIPKSKKDELS